MTALQAPKVSICIPCYKNQASLRRLFISIDQQTFRSFEVIVTDDSPNDELSLVVREFQEKFPIQYIHNQPALGPAKNWNKALKLGTCELLKIMHHDDWFSRPDSLQKFVSLMDDNPKAMMGFSGTANLDTKESLKNVHFAFPGELETLRKDPTYLCLGNIIGAPTAVIVRREVDVFYDPALKWLVDVDYYIMILLKYSVQFAATSEALVNVTVASNDQLTAFCEGNLTVEVEEFAHVYSKITKLVGRKLYAFSNIWNLVLRFGINRFNFQSLVPNAQPFRNDCAKVVTANFLLHKIERANTLFWKLINPISWCRFVIKRSTYLFCKLLPVTKPD